MDGKGLFIIIVVLLGLTGCIHSAGNPADPSVDISADTSADLCAELEKHCKDTYEQALADGTLGSLPVVEEMVHSLGQAGYAAAHLDNQVDMENPGLLEAFCEDTDAKQEAELPLILVLNSGNFVWFQLASADGQVDVVVKSLSWKENRLVNMDSDHYQAYSWVHDNANGYLFFERYYVEGFSGPYDHVAVRLKPLDKHYRELNRAYILPAGYRSNNLFTSDWSEPDFLTLDFCDLYDIFFRLVYPQRVPYSADSDGETYRILQEEFEGVIQAYLNIDSQTLRSKADYLADYGAYAYRPRGMYDSGMGAEVPYPEVIGCEDRADGTIELLVNAVWPQMNLGTAFRHKVVIRPLPDGRFQYVSNQVIPSEDNVAASWYVHRRTGD